MTALVQHPEYLQTAMPAKIAAPIYARYLAGMEYGGHIDDPIMGAPGARYRSDISISVFLNAPMNMMAVNYASKPRKAARHTSCRPEALCSTRRPAITR